MNKYAITKDGYADGRFIYQPLNSKPNPDYAKDRAKARNKRNPQWSK